MSKLHQILDDYLATRRAMGYKLQHADRRLLQFIESVLDEGSDFITTGLAFQWATTPVGTSTKWWATRLSMIRQFALYAQAFDPRTEVPPHYLIPYSSRRPAPYIYSKDEIDRLLAAARRQQDRLSAATDPTLFGLIAVTGMRVGEAISLDRCDLDHDQGLLTVRGTKFGKSRQLPLHPSTVEALDRYGRSRDRRIPLQYSSALFLSRSGKPMFYSNVHRRFHRLIDRAGLVEAGRRCPRIHDLRHTFAVRTLLGWYRAGLQVQPRLPLLSTYLGHINPAMTYWYLSAVPELLQLVSERCRRSEVGS